MYVAEDASTVKTVFKSVPSQFTLNSPLFSPIAKPEKEWQIQNKLGRNWFESIFYRASVFNISLVGCINKSFSSIPRNKVLHEKATMVNLILLDFPTIFMLFIFPLLLQSVFLQNNIWFWLCKQNALRGVQILRR